MSGPSFFQQYIFFLNETGSAVGSLIEEALDNGAAPDDIFVLAPSVRSPNYSSGPATTTGTTTKDVPEGTYLNEFISRLFNIFNKKYGIFEKNDPIFNKNEFFSWKNQLFLIDYSISIK